MVSSFYKKRFLVTKYSRIKQYLELLEKNCKAVHLQPSEKRTIKNINYLITKNIKKIKTITITNYILYFGLYFGFISLFFSDIIFFGLVTEIVGKIIGVFGSSLFVIGLFITTKLEDLYYGDLFLLSSQFIAIYTKAGIKGEGLFSEENNFENFVRFFKKRGFDQEE
jgi:hypothetical protein